MGLVVTLVVTALKATAQGTSLPPRFEDYPVKEIFKGSPASPILVTPEQRLFRTRIREGVTKGVGVWRDGKSQPGPNFAGHYIVVRWMCGSPCGMMAVVDASNGQVHGPPISGGDGRRDLAFLLPEVWLPDTKTGAPWVADVEFRANSSLMIVKANDVLKDGQNYAYFYLWQNDRWTLLRRTRMEVAKP